MDSGDLSTFANLGEVFSGVRAPQYLDKLPDGSVYKSFPLVDGSVPDSIYDLDRIVMAVDEFISESRLTYIHCHGGHGRTGLVVACWLILKGALAVDALREIYRLRVEASERLGRVQSPQTSIQVEWVLAYEQFLQQEERFVGDQHKLFDARETV